MDKENLRNIIRKNLILLRMSKGITQADLAAELNKSSNAVASWEQGLSLPDVTTLYQLSKVYNKELNYFYEDHGEYDNIEQVRRLSAYTEKIRERVKKWKLKRE